MPLFLSGCQIGYLFHVSYNHLSILSSTESIEGILNSDRLTLAEKNKVRLSQEARIYAFEKLKLKKTDNYSRYVELKRNYVTYTVTASEKWKFQPYLWDFPIIGRAPYKGFYSEDKAKAEADELEKKNLDVSVRGVSAYSTLGKMTDPLLSSMLNYPEHVLVNTIIHELVHTTLFIKDNIDFNERLAVFVANKGTEQFYLEKEGPKSPTLALIQSENDDDTLFSGFITAELDELKKWYAEAATNGNINEDQRQERLQLIARHFEVNLKSRLKTKSYERLFSKKFNNADLSVFNTYMKSLDIFENVYKKTGSNIPDFLEKCAALIDADDPEKELERWSQEQTL